MASAPSAASRAPEPAPADWPGYNRTLAGDRFSPLDEINRGNVAGLQEVCTYALPRVIALQVSPVVIDGTMYFTSDTHSYAIDAATCAEKWAVEHPLERRSALGAHRGFAYLDGRLFRGTSDGHVLALDAADGHTLWSQAIDDMAPGVSTSFRTLRPCSRPGRIAIATRSPVAGSGRRLRTMPSAACTTCRRVTPRPTSTSKRAAAPISTRTRSLRSMRPAAACSATTRSSRPILTIGM